MWIQMRIVIVVSALDCQKLSPVSLGSSWGYPIKVLHEGPQSLYPIIRNRGERVPVYALIRGHLSIARACAI